MSTPSRSFVFSISRMTRKRANFENPRNRRPPPPPFPSLPFPTMQSKRRHLSKLENLATIKIWTRNPAFMTVKCGGANPSSAHHLMLITVDFYGTALMLSGSVSPSLSLCLRLSLCLCLCLSVSLSLSIFVCLPVCLCFSHSHSLSLSVCLFVCMFVTSVTNTPCKI